LKSASLGKTADVLLAKPLRNNIVEEYKDDEVPKNKNAEYYDEINTLCIDMSDPNVQQTIGEMEKYKSILTMIITGGKFGAPVDLKSLLTKAAHYPLKELYIINFGKFVTSVPEQINGYKDLNVLSLINNKISKLPDAVKSLTNLKTLYVDLNPIKVIINDVTPLSDLEKLGVVKTKISKEEIAKIKSLLPNCKIEPL
jgi:Leucine-rich repeat (LRR) protein